MIDKSKVTYFEKEDVLHLMVSDEPESNSVELSPNITAELNENGELTNLGYVTMRNMILNKIS